MNTINKLFELKGKRFAHSHAKDTKAKKIGKSRPRSSRISDESSSEFDSSSSMDDFVVNLIKLYHINYNNILGY